MRRRLRLSLGLGLLASCGCNAAEHVFAPLPSLAAGTSGLLVTEGRGGAPVFESYEPDGPGAHIEVQAGAGNKVYCAVLDGPLDRLGLPLGRWDQWSGPQRDLAEINILEALVLDEGGLSPALRPDPSVTSFLAKLQVPDLRRCFQPELRPGALMDQSPRLLDVLDLGADQFLSLDGNGTLELYEPAGRNVVGLAGGSQVYPRSLAFDPGTNELFIVSLFGSGLLRASVPEGSFAALDAVAVRFEGTERADSIDIVAPEPSGPSLMAIATVDAQGARRVRLRGDGRDDRILELPAELSSGLGVRVAGPDAVLLYSEDELWHLSSGSPPSPITLDQTTNLLVVRWVPPFGVLLGLSDGTVRRLAGLDLETVAELGGWWVLDLAPFQRGFAYLLANGVIGQFIEGEGRCAETPVLGTLKDGRLVPTDERWFVSGVLPEGGARLAILPRASSL